MIPVKLALRNFMCYHDEVPALSFDSFRVACLSGDNGHGKSALLDAITWALWGKARARSDDDLVHMGESEMEVEFEFCVDHNRYRVIRKRSKAGPRRTGHSSLELQVGSPDGFAPIGGNSIRETEKKITDLLRMDYDTFINSALLLQGRADEFSMKRPGERKEVLANILGLSLYDDLEKLARSLSREREMRQQDLGNSLARIEEQLEKKKAYENALDQAQSALSAILEQLETEERTVNGLRQSLEALRFKEQQAQEAARQIDQADRQMRYLQGRASEHCERIQKYEKALSGYEESASQARANLKELESRGQDIAKNREAVEEISNRIHHLRSVNAQLKTEMEELKKKIDLLAEEQARCPLCGTELGEEGKQRIVDSYEADGKEKGEAYRRNKAEIEERERELKSLRHEAAHLEGQVAATRTRWERQLEALERDRAEAEGSLPREKEAFDHTRQAIDGWRSTLDENANKRKAILAEIESLPRTEADFREAERRYRELRERERGCRDSLVELQANLRRCAQLEAEKKDTAEALGVASEEKGIYDELAVAFGKRGVQALIIESALPEIEEEANRLLGRMTDNRMHVRIESQRDTKKGDTIETLEIRIADELGTRNYEMFSGGEAFRVNFALRIALSKMLARRAGAPLPTIIIDEGFGTQDTAGREKLVEAIESIQEDFEKILVITHIEELKNAFPVRIDVVKTEDGSTFSLN